MVNVVNEDSTKTFAKDSNVVEKKYCTETGLLATSKCKNTAVGYYKADNLPKTCDSTQKHGGETLLVPDWGTQKAEEDTSSTSSN